MLAIETHNLSKRFGDTTAVRDLELRIPKGILFGFLGPNGSGKSTTLRMLTGLLAPTTGEVIINGLPVTGAAVEVKRQIGVLPEELALFDSLTIWEHLLMVGPVYGLSRAETERRGEQLLNYLDLWTEGNTYVDQASSGMRKKCSLAYSLRLLDPYFGVLVSALGCLYLISSTAPAVTAVMAVILIIFIPNAPLAFNSFGLDTRSGMDRYALLPAAGRAIIRSKNLAFAMLAGVQMLPLILLSGWRLGLLTSFVAFVEAASLAGAYLAWGNWSSVTLPSKMYFHRFAPATNAIPEIIAGVVINSLPGVLILFLIRAYGEQAIWAALPILLACVLWYLLATNLSGRRFVISRERIRDSLA